MSPSRSERLRPLIRRGDLPLGRGRLGASGRGSRSGGRGGPHGPNPPSVRGRRGGPFRRGLGSFSRGRGIGAGYRGHNATKRLDAHPNLWMRGGACRKKVRRRPTLPGGLPPSTIGAGGLHCRVRNGNGCFPAAVATGTSSGSQTPLRTPERARAKSKKIPSPRPISTGRLNTSPCVHLRPINLVVYQGPYPVNPVGDLILRQASRLDAFSAYPFRRSPTSHALGRTTGTRELRPSRSSRTRDSSPQVSFAHSG